MIIRKMLYLFLLVSIALIASIVFQAYYILLLSEEKSEIEASSRLLYSHIYSINSNVLKTKTCVKDFIISQEPKYLSLHKYYTERIAQELFELRQKMEINTDIALPNSLKNTYTDYQYTIQSIINKHEVRLREFNHQDSANAERRAKLFIAYINEIQPIFNEFIETNSITALNSFSSFFRGRISKIMNTTEELLYLLIMSAVLLFTQLIAFVWYIRRAVIAPIKHLVDATESAASGNYAHLELNYKWHNEISSYIDSFSKLLDNLKVSEDSNKYFRWMQESENQLYQKLINVQNRDDFYPKLLKELCSRVSAFSAMLYLFDPVSNKLIYTDAYSPVRSQTRQSEIQLSQGLIGEFALKQEVSIVKDLPDEYYFIESTMGRIKAKELAFVPLRLDAQLLGIIEIGTINSFTNPHIEYLARASKIAVSTIQLSNYYDN